VLANVRDLDQYVSRASVACGLSGQPNRGLIVLVENDRLNS